MTRHTPADRDWVRATVCRHEGPLTRYAARMLGGDVDRARDVAQDVFLKLWQADRSAIEPHLAQWLFRVCRNGALDVMRKEGRMTALDDRDLERKRPPDAEPGSSGETGESAGRLVKMVDALPPRQQEAIRLKFQNGLSYGEISAVMDTTVSNVGVLIHTGLKAIRAKITAEPGQRVSR